MRKITIFVLALVCMLGLVACTGKNMKFDIGVANSINIKSGLTGDEINITDKEIIQSITQDINSLRFEKTSESDGKVGYVYMVKWFDADGKQMESITITEENGYQISYGGYFYKVGADLCIDVTLIDKLISTTAED